MASLVPGAIAEMSEAHGMKAGVVTSTPRRGGSRPQDVQSRMEK